MATGNQKPSGEFDVTAMPTWLCRDVFFDGLHDALAPVIGLGVISGSDSVPGARLVRMSIAVEIEATCGEDDDEDDKDDDDQPKLPKT